MNSSIGPRKMVNCSGTDKRAAANREAPRRKRGPIAVEYTEATRPLPDWMTDPSLLPRRPPGAR